MRPVVAIYPHRLVIQHIAQRRWAGQWLIVNTDPVLSADGSGMFGHRAVNADRTGGNQAFSRAA